MTANAFHNIAQIETSLWDAADQLRANSNLTATEYSMPVLGVIFLRHATNRYQTALQAIEADQAAGNMPKRPLSKADFIKRRALLLPEAARYDTLLNLPSGASLGGALVAAMNAIEADFAPLQGSLPKDYDRFDNKLLENLLRCFDSEALRQATGDVFGRSRHRPRDAEHLYGGPHPFIQTGDVKHAGLYINSFTQTYTEAGLAQSKLWPAGTLCITIAANIADTAILGIDACFPDSVIGFIADPKKADTRFVKYLFDANIKIRAQQFSQGATQDNLSQEKLLSLEFEIPEVEQQKRIADVLSSYDDLIDNNIRRMALLEDSARQLYREWFVRLRFPGHEHTPIVDGVPQGWERKTLGDLCREVRDMVLPEALEPDTPYIGLEHIPRRSISLSDWGTVEEVTSSKCRFKAGEIIFGKIRPYFHKVGVAFVDGVTSSDAIVVRPLDESLHGLVLMTMSSDEFVAVTSQQMKEGSKMPRADWKQMKAFSVQVPPPGLLKNFDDVIQPTVEQLRTLSFANQKLRQARDLLLPRLMNGELAV